MRINPRRPHVVVNVLAWGIICGSLLPSAYSQVAKSQGNNASSDAAPRVQWIWCSGDRAPGQSATFSREIELPTIPASALLTVGAESTSLDLFLDGEPLGHLEPYAPVRHIDLSDRIGSEPQNLIVRATSVEGPAAFFAQLQIVHADGRRELIGSDSEWHCQRANQRGNVTAVFCFGGVDERLLIPPREVGISRLDNYEQWKLAQNEESQGLQATISVARGFEIQRVRSATGDEDSWVCMAFDPQGRIVVAKEQKGLLRLTLSADGNTVAKTEVIDSELKECRGIAFANGHMFVNANNDKGLYRVELNPDGSLGRRTLLYASEGGVGHGRNDLTIGSDGKIYTIQGDSVQLPTGARDWTSPFRDARRGKQTKEGHLLRIDPTNGQVELLSAGLRNPFGVALNSHGDAFTYDADAEFDMGAPWYRPTRVSHLVAGGDYGWRGVTGSWPAYYPDHPDNAPSNLDIGKGSPTAVKFGTKSDFPPRFRDALFVMDWAYGRILAVHTIRRGASYLMTAETFLKGKPLNVTSLDFAPEGSMYFVTGGRKTQSSLFCVRYVGDRQKSTDVQATAQQLARDEFATKAHGKRRRFESLLMDARLEDSDWRDVIETLSDADPWLRYAARGVVEGQPRAEYLRVLDRPAGSIPVDAFMLFLRTKEPTLARSCIEKMNEVDWLQLNVSQQRVIAYCYWSSLKLLDESKTAVAPELKKKTAERLARVYPSGDYEVDQWLSEILVRNDEPMLAATLDRLQATTNQNRRMHFIYVLRNKRTEWTADKRRVYFQALTDTRDYVGGQGMPGFIEQIRKGVQETLVDGERKLYDELAVVHDDDTTQTVSRDFVKKWTLAELSSSEPIRTDTGNAERGRQLFRETSCIQCHRFRNSGGVTAPDLTFVSSRFGRADLLRSIVEPSTVIAEKYRSLQIITEGGQVLIGRPAPGGDYRSPVLRLAIDPLNIRKVVEINKEEIASQKPSPTSWMPTGLLDTLNEAEIIDLLTFLESAP